jgi:hypothetical protein
VNRVQDAREYDALALVDERVDLRAEQIPDEAVLDGAVRLLLAEKRHSVESDLVTICCA